MEAEDTAWTDAALALWARIEAHPFERPSIALDFTRRLARQLGWSLDMARTAVGEYRRFCFLAMVSRGHPMTPSEEVDEVWHLHLTFTRDYWERWCGNALRRPLHHDPTEGGPAENARYRAQYAETLALYERYFGPPPEAFWPGTAQRFAGAPRYRQVDGARMFVLPRPRLPRLSRASLLAGVIALLWSGPASAREVGIETTWNVLDWTAGPFLTLYIPLMLIATALAYALSENLRDTGRRGDARRLDTLSIAYLIDGSDHAADTLLLQAAIENRVRFDKKRTWLEQTATTAPDRLEPFGPPPPGGYRRKTLLKYFARSRHAQEIRRDLERRNLLLDEARVRLMRTAIRLSAGPVLLLGLAKLVVGSSRGKPVGYLFMIALIAAIANIILMARNLHRTRDGNDVVRNLRKDRSRAMRAPLQAELPLAFAVLGAPALAGTDYSALAAQISTGCGGGGDGGGGCGGGGGGGGCGGCGG